jgi:hypothetical protein
MRDLAKVEIERDVADTAAQRAAQEGLTVSAYISLLLRRTFERAPGEESVLVYDHIGGSEHSQIQRELHEDDESYERRLELYRSLFGRG